MAIKFAAKDQPKAPDAPSAVKASAAKAAQAPKQSAAPGDGADLFEAAPKTPGRKKKAK